MRKLARLLVLLLIAAFAAATLAPAADATAMAVTMSLGDEGEGDGCDGCPGADSDLSPCDQACPISLLALPAGAAAAPPVAAGHPEAVPERSFAGWRAPPDLSPPRLSF